MRCVTMPIIRLENVQKKYKNQMLFRDVNLSFEKSRIYGVVGPNGSGKSVLFKLICGFLEPDQGEVWIDKKYRPANTRFPINTGIIINTPGYLSNKTGFENLKELAVINSITSDEKIRQTMITLGLQPDLSEKMKNYSLGMKQKIGIAQAIMEDQEILLLDEPFNGLDAAAVTKVRTLLLEYKKEGKLIVLTSHNPQDIDILCDYICELENETITLKENTNRIGVSFNE